MLDKVALKLKAGDGGRGAVTFRREKYIPFGGPFGGDGGRGGDVIVKADASVSTLRAFQRRRSFKAENAGVGMTKNKHGKNGEDLTLKVPAGTLVFIKPDAGEPVLMADLEKDGQQVVVCRGGRGGYGNLHFASATNQAPRIAQPGSEGDERTIILELRLIADVGIVGFPNVGKSSLLAAVSAANPKIADYPFTTLEPILGVVNVDPVDKEMFVLAEIPGLIEGAHTGKGLGDEFLRHAMRTSLLIHLINGASETPVEDWIHVNNELALWDATLATRTQVVAVNKVDLPEVKAQEKVIKAAFAEAGITPFFISASAGIGLEELKAETWKLLKEAKALTGNTQSLTVPPKVFHPQAVDSLVKIRKKGETFILSEPAVVRLLDKLDLDNPVQLKEFNQALEKLGVNKMLKASGVKSGDTVIAGDVEWEWYED